MSMNPKTDLKSRFGRFLACLCTALIVAGGAPPYAGTAERAPLVPQQHLLPNGLKIILLEDHSFPVACCLVWYKVGARNETPGCTGLSHLVEHLLFGPAGQLKQGELGALIAREGGQFNGYTSDDFTTFFETLPSSRIELALKVESLRMRGATFTQADVEREIPKIQEELDAESKDPIELLGREVRALAFQQHPYHNPTMGWANDVETLTAQQARKFYDTYYWPNNATIVITGDIDSQTMPSLIAKYFGCIPRSPNAIPSPVVTESSPRGERTITMRLPGKQEITEVAYRAPSLADGDAAALVVLEKMLNASYQGRLKTKLAESKICAWASAGYEAKKDPGLFTITCHASAGTGRERVVDGVESMLASLRAQAVSEAELRRARNQAEFAFFAEREGPYRAGFHLGYFESLATWRQAYSWPERIRAVTTADILRVARRYLTAETRVVGHVIPSGSSKPPTAKPGTQYMDNSSPRSPQRSAFHATPFDTYLAAYKASDEGTGSPPPVEGTANVMTSPANRFVAEFKWSKEESIGAGKSTATTRKLTTTRKSELTREKTSSSTARPESAKEAPNSTDRRVRAADATPTAAPPDPGKDISKGAAKPSSTRAALKPAAKPEQAKEASKPAAKPEQAKEALKPAAKPEQAKEASKPAAKPEQAREASKPAAKSEQVREASKPAAKSEQAKEALKPAAKPQQAKEALKPAAKPQQAKGVSKFAATPSSTKDAAKPGPVKAASKLEAKPDQPKETSKSTAKSEPPKETSKSAGKVSGSVSPLEQQPATQSAGGKTPKCQVTAQGATRASPPLVPSLFQTIQHKVLKNGLTLVVFESHLSPVVQITGAIRAGEVFEPHSKKGISSVAAALLNGALPGKSRAQALCQQEDAGLPPYAMLHFEPGAETINLEARCLSRDLASELSLVAESVTGRQVDEQELCRAKQEASAYVRHADESANAKVRRALAQMLVSASSAYYDSGPFERVKSIGALKREDVESFFSQHIVAPDTVLVLSGDISMEQAAPMVERIFGSWVTNKESSSWPPLDAMNRVLQRTSIPTKEHAPSLVSFGRVVRMQGSDANIGSLLLADCILAGHPMYSRLSQRLGLDQALAAALRTEAMKSKIEPQSNCLIWSLACTVDRELAPRLIECVRSESEKLVRSGISSEELQEHKRYLSGNLTLRMMSNLSLAGRTIVQAVLHYNETDSLPRLTESVMTATCDSVNQIIRSSFSPSDYSLAFTGDSHVTRAVRTQFAAQRRAGSQDR